MPGRWDEVRPPSTKELAATLVLAVALDEVSVKVRSGPPSDDEPVPAHEVATVWAGELPLRLEAGEPVAAPDGPDDLRCRRPSSPRPPRSTVRPPPRHERPVAGAAAASGPCRRALPAGTLPHRPR